MEITGIEPIYYECKSYILPNKSYLQKKYYFNLKIRNGIEPI